MICIVIRHAHFICTNTQIIPSKQRCDPWTLHFPHDDKSKLIFKLIVLYVVTGTNCIRS